MLTEAPRLVVATAYVKAMTSAVLIIEAEIWAQCPEREENERDEDSLHLREAIMHIIEVDSRFRGVHAQIGFGPEGHKALWVEYGHRMVGHKPDKKLLGQVLPHPFIRRAFDSAAPRALAAFASIFESEMRRMYG